LHGRDAVISGAIVTRRVAQRANYIGINQNVAGNDFVVVGIQERI
jgi:hypothetical protein